MEKGLYIKSADVDIRTSQESKLAGLLLEAMYNGKDLPDQFVSNKLAMNLAKILTKYSRLIPEAKNIGITGSMKGSGCFFTGGVDSFYTFSCNPEVKLLVYVEGFDIPLKEKDFMGVVVKRLREAAKEMGKELAVLQTNYRDEAKVVPWEQQFGSALVMIAMSLQNHLNKMYIAGGEGLWGQQKEIDELWSTETMEIIHHGDVSRIEKIKAISTIPTAMKHLRVCWESTTEYNCGKCEKCLRTLTQFYIAGKLEAVKSFGKVTVRSLSDAIDRLGKLDGKELDFTKSNHEACPKGIIEESLFKLINK